MAHNSIYCSWPRFLSSGIFSPDEKLKAAVKMSEKTKIELNTNKDSNNQTKLSYAQLRWSLLIPAPRIWNVCVKAETWKKISLSYIPLDFKNLKFIMNCFLNVNICLPILNDVPDFRSETCEGLQFKSIAQLRQSRMWP